MANLMDLLQSQLSEGMIDQLAQQIGGAQPEQTKAATAGIMNSVMEALAKNASTPEGAASLNNALERDHDGSVLDNLMGMLGGAAQPPQQQSRAMNGAGILKHVLGNKQGGIAEMISQVSGLNTNQTGSLMSMLAPMIMGTLGKAKQQQGLDQGGLVDMLTQSVQNNRQQNAQNPMMGMITKFLDQDGDGSIMDDVMGMVGKSVLKNLFK